MERPAFDSLTTVQFQLRMKAAALRIYRTVFPDCELVDLRENGVSVHVLDKEFGIDALINLPSGQWLSIQEKYRKNYALKYLDFTQEYMNGAGTKHESPGEWFKLGSQLYFYGWANEQETAFQKWVILDVTKYKLLVEKAGGLDKLGTKQRNTQHGSSSFFAIPIVKLSEAFVCDYRQYSTVATN